LLEGVSALGVVERTSYVGSAVRFLAPDSASFITGQIIVVDGGASIGKVAL